MPLPERVFVVVIETDAGHDPDRMPLLNRQVDGRRLAPVFSSMLLATGFLSRAQELGYYVKLDYIFPLEGGLLADDFPEYEFQLDPTPDTFFGAS